jgi:hypothetical protein
MPLAGLELQMTPSRLSVERDEALDARVLVKNKSTSDATNPPRRPLQPRTLNGFMTAAEAIGLAASIVAVGGASVGLWRYSADVYGRTLGSRRRLIAKLRQIGPGVTVEHVAGLLGPPVYTRKPESVTPDEPGVLWSSLESIFFTRHAYVQVVHDTQGEVLGFGVTTIDPDFNFEMPQLPPIGSGKKPVRLVRTHFGDIPLGDVRGWWLHRGPYRGFYWELLAFGRSAGPLARYMNFALARNSSGVGSYGDASAVEMAIPDPSFIRRGGAPGLDKFRKQTAINTVCIYSAKVPLDDIPTGRSPWGIGIDNEATPDLLELYRGPIRRIRDAARLIKYRLSGHGAAT